MYYSSAGLVLRYSLMFTGHTEICITENGGSFILRNIVVAAAGRKLGKTLLCTELVRLLHDSGYSIAYCKLARHVLPEHRF